MKLGRKRPTPQHKAKALPLAKYLRAKLPTAPPSFSGSQGAAIGMWGNDLYGDCTFAALANTRAICAAREGLPPPATSADVVAKTYLDFTGGQDSGAVENEVLDLALRGVELGGDPWMLAAWVAVDLSDIETCKSLISQFWSLYLGVELPVSAQNQRVWDVSSGPDAAFGSWGGHALVWPNYTPKNVGFVTWGTVQEATYSWLSTYADEAYCLLDADRAKMIGVDWDALIADMRAQGPVNGGL